MKKLIVTLFAVGIALALSTSVKAQVEVEVSATVLQTISFGTVTNISFGNVEAGSVAEVQANASDIDSDNASAPVAGTFTITGGAQDYNIIQDAAAILALSTDENTTLTFSARYFIGTTNITADVTDTGYVVDDGGAVTLEIGGQLASPSTTGTYGTTQTGGTNLGITVAYTGL